MTQIVQKKSGVVRGVLRSGMRIAASFFPKTPTIRQTTLNGFPLVVWANEHIGRRILAAGGFETEELNLFPTFVAPGEVCVDVGANIGIHSINLARAVGTAGRVIAFEPVHRNALVVRLNCELNELGNVTVEQMPLSDKSGGALSIEVPTGDSAYSYFVESDSGDVTGVTLDDYCARNDVSQVHFMKIDVEGAEMKVLRGAGRLLSGPGKPRTIVVEVVADYLRRFNDTVAELVGYLEKHGYVAHTLRAGKLVRSPASEIAEENVYFLAG